MAAGQQLRSLRERRGITVREVEEATGRVANAIGDQRYQISNGWLVQLEKCFTPPNIYHLFALGATYRVRFLELLRCYGINVEDQVKYEAVANPEITQLLSPDDTCFDFVAPAETRLAPELTAKLPVGLTCAPNNGHSNLTYAQLGPHELTMYPLIRPGAILAVDTSDKKIEAGTWNNKLDRPIYFIELRNGFTCGWCELLDHKLQILSYRSSSRREFAYPQDAEIVGRVVAYYTPCVDVDVNKRALNAEVQS